MVFEEDWRINRIDLWESKITLAEFEPKTIDSTHHTSWAIGGVNFPASHHSHKFYHFSTNDEINIPGLLTTTLHLPKADDFLTPGVPSQSNHWIELRNKLEKNDDSWYITDEQNQSALVRLLLESFFILTDYDLPNSTFPQVSFSALSSEGLRWSSLVWESRCPSSIDPVLLLKSLVCLYFWWVVVV